jgi:nucleotide-binding universal stress UspA family protein
MNKEKAMYNTILVPLDGSPRAERILPHAEALAHKFGARLVLLQVIEPVKTEVSPYGVVPYYDMGMIEQMTEAAQTYLAGLQEQFSQKKIEVKALVENAPVISAILTVATHENVDLIAMASHGRTGLARVFYGSVAAGILNQADRPLLLIRAQA